MVLTDKKTGKLFVEIDMGGLDAVSSIEIRRKALYDALVEHNSTEFIGNNDMVYGLVLLLQDLDPTTQQWQKILQT